MADHDREVYDPFIGKTVRISNNLLDRLRGRYASGPTLPNGEPEFGWRQMPQVSIQLEAATRIAELTAVLREMIDVFAPGCPADFKDGLCALEAARTLIGVKTPAER